MTKIIKTYTFLSVIILLQICLIAYFGYKKEGLFMDELWTFNLSNGYFFPMVGDASSYYDRWLPGDFFHDALVASKPFSFDSVFYNQSADVHPPLYYAIIHFICSITIGEYSKWHGIILNIALFLISQILLFELTKKVTKETRYALVVCFLYGFSIGTISMCVSIRMYMLLTLFTVLITYLHYLYFNLVFHNESFSSKTENILIIIVGTSYMLGFLVHYYFVIYAFFLSLFTLPIIYIFSGCKSLIKYVLGTVSGIISAVMIFPSCLTHILGSGYRGVEAFNNLHETNIYDRVKDFLSFVNNETGVLTITSVCILLFTFTKLLRCCDIGRLGYRKNIEVTIPIKCLKFNLCHNRVLLTVIALALISSFILISKIAGFVTPRYIWHLQPLIVIIAFLLSIKCIDKTLKNKNFAICFIVIIFVAVMTPNIRTKNIAWLYTVDKPVFDILNENSKLSKKMIAIQSDKTWWPMMAGVKFFEKTEYTLMTTFDNIQNIRFEDKSYFIFISHQANQSQTKEIFNYLNSHGYKSITTIYSEWPGNIYRITKS